ncbi:lipocalin-like domain-containing protein [Seonamhaeicola maritimus]|uniref:Lipocalin family protein n=1 Tax=Seonamhaeicola maritimus TaxID=2591822 RepID=A0A5C7GK44_9FLAO|nr:lipocalin family protein [Seonamhaeicola maritimus]TXG38654.1 lipocalin family protein [Seonamhaeicola maritimus]
MKTQYLSAKLLLIFLVFNLGCSKSDDGADSQTTLEQQFIGTWKPLKFVIVCSDGGNEIENYSACEQTGRLTISSNGTWSETYFYEYVDNMCEEDGVDSGTWKIVNGKLIIKESEFGEAEVTFFEISESTLKVGQYDDDFSCGIDNVSSHYYTEYVKI